MILFIIAILSFILAILGMSISFKNEIVWLEVVSTVMVFFGFFTAVFIGAAWSTDYDVSKKLSEYSLLEESIASYETGVPISSGMYLDLCKRVEYTNSYIATQKKHAGNVMTGVCYSEELAELEPLSYDTEKMKIVNGTTKTH